MSETESNDNPMFLRKSWMKRHMNVSGRQASAIESAFVTKGQLVDALESGEDIEERDGIGPKTASSIWEWFREVYNGSVEVDDTLVLDDEGLHHPEWLVGRSGTVVVNTPSITMRAQVSDHGLPEVSTDLLSSYPSAGEWNDLLDEGMIQIQAGLNKGIFKIDDQRSEAER